MRRPPLKHPSSSSENSQPSSAIQTASMGATTRARYSYGLSLFTLLLISAALSPFSVTAQRVVTSPQSYEVKVGGSVELPCVFSDVDHADDQVVVWKRSDGTLISMDDTVEINDNRVSLTRVETDYGYTLRIVSLEPYDSADYTCSITSSPPLEVTHKLLVNVPPTAKLNTQSPLQVRVGEEVHVRCSANGNPQPILHWRRVNEQSGGAQPLPPGSTTHHGHLRIEQVSETDSGLYECRASNGVGQESMVQLELRVKVPGSNGGAAKTDDSTTSDDDEGGVLSAPWVDTDRIYIPVQIGSDAEIICRYGGNPAPDIEWYYSGFKINRQTDERFKAADEHASVQKNYSVSTFSLKDIQEDHFGDYSCKASNQLGADERRIHVSGRPGPPTLVLRGNKLHWTLASTSPVTSYKLLYREKQEDMWPHEKEIKASRDDQSGDIWEHAVSLDFLKPSTSFELQLKGKNSLGYGSLATHYITYDPSGNSDNGEGKWQPEKQSDPSFSLLHRPWVALILLLLLILVLV